MTMDFKVNRVSRILIIVCELLFLNALLYRTIQSLENKERSIVMLFYLAEKSLKEIKMITGIKISTIKVILHRARIKLYNKLKPVYETAR